MSTVPRLSFSQTVAYSFGWLGVGVYIAFNNFTLPLYLSIFTQDAIVIGWLSSTRSFEQLLIQPIVGAWSDRTWTRFGRRAPFFLTTMPLVALLLVYNAFIPRDPTYLWPVIATVFLFSLLFNIGVDPYITLMADVTPAYQRGTVSGAGAVFGFLGEVGILLVAAVLLGRQVSSIFVIVALIIVFGFAVAAIGVKEHRNETTLRLSKPRLSIAEFLHYARNLYREHPNALKLLIVRFLYHFGVNSAVPFITLFVVKEVGLKGWPELLAVMAIPKSLGLERMGANGVSQLLVAVLFSVTVLWSIPFGVLGDRIGKKRVLGFGLLLMGIVGIFASFSSSIPQLILYLLLLGIGKAAVDVLQAPYLTELVPPHRFGEFIGIASFAETAGVIVSVLIAGGLVNLNLFGLGYRVIFLLTSVFVLAAFLALFLVQSRRNQDISAK